MEAYSGSNTNAEATRKQIEKAMLPDTCRQCGVGQALTRVQQAEQAAAAAQAKVEEDTEKIERSQARIDNVLAEETPPNVGIRIRAHLELVVIEPQRANLIRAQADSAAAEQEYQKAQAAAR
jgi:hypothetical protein